MSINDSLYRVLAGWVMGDTEAWIALGDVETRLLGRILSPVVAPIYITGLARAGTTILTEAIAAHPEIATHTYRDFPCLFTPYFWNRILKSFDWVPTRIKPQERAHQDGILVTPKSPEAMEEILWMAFFKYLHDEKRSSLLTGNTDNPAFADFYRAHISKLLKVRKKYRYASKANYNLTRIPYLLSLFPDARFVVVVRNPFAHVSSLLRKHALFLDKQDKNPATLVHMDQVGHFEFGKHRTLIHTGDDTTIASIEKCFAAEDNVRGWARYWAMLHRFILEQCASLPQVIVVRHEDLCRDSHQKMPEIYQHCQLKYNDTMLAAASAKFRATGPAMLDNRAHNIIHEETSMIAMKLGYSD